MASQATAGNGTRVNTTSDFYQSSSSTAALADGGWLVTWRGNGPGDPAGVYLQRYDAAGGAVGVETLVNTYTTDRQETPFAAGLSDGGWVISWSGAGADDNSGAFQQRYDSFGATVGTTVRINTTTDGIQENAPVAALNDGGWVTAWQGSGPGDPRGVMGRRFEADSDPTSPNLRINATVPGNQADPAVTGLTDGSWLVVWQSDPQGFGGGRDIYLQRYTQNWVAWGPPDTRELARPCRR